MIGRLCQFAFVYFVFLQKNSICVCNLYDEMWLFIFMQNICDRKKRLIFLIITYRMGFYPKNRWQWKSGAAFFWGVIFVKQQAHDSLFVLSHHRMPSRLQNEKSIFATNFRTKFIFIRPLHECKGKYFCTRVRDLFVLTRYIHQFVSNSTFCLVENCVCFFFRSRWYFYFIGTKKRETIHGKHQYLFIKIDDDADDTVKQFFKLFFFN